MSTGRGGMGLAVLTETTESATEVRPDPGADTPNPGMFGAGRLFDKLVSDTG